MAGTTTLGYPYPSAGDSMSDEAAKVQELAQFADDNVGLQKVGLTSVALPGVNPVDGAQAVLFATPFPVGTTPRVTATLNVANPRNFAGPTVSAVTRTGFTINVSRTNGAVTPVDVSWQAVVI